jgi:hypothetical protein
MHAGTLSLAFAYIAAILVGGALLLMLLSKARARGNANAKHGEILVVAM